MIHSTLTHITAYKLKSATKYIVIPRPEIPDLLMKKVEQANLALRNRCDNPKHILPTNPLSNSNEFQQVNKSS